MIAYRDPNHARNAINKLKKEYDLAYEDGVITLEERNDAFNKLEASEAIILNSRFKGLDIQEKLNVVNNLVEIQTLQQQISEVQSRIKEAKQKTSCACL